MSSRKDKLTKRIALGVVFSVCDPLELESPVVAELKLTIQSFWKESQVWGDVLSDEKGRTFQDVSSGWRKQKLGIPRQSVEEQSRYEIELHSFADASKWVFAVACYGRAVVAGDIKKFLIAFKPKLCSLKSDAIP